MLPLTPESRLFVLAVVWEALESSYPVLQTGATPSQLPDHFLLSSLRRFGARTKKARRHMTPGLARELAVKQTSRNES
jgi:hypothetical protein